jgi:hypothetical protein
LEVPVVQRDALGIHAIADRDNHIQVVMRERPRHLAIPLHSNLSEFPTGCFRRQFALAIDVFYMFYDARPSRIKQFSDLLLRQPDRFVFEPDINFRNTRGVA